MAASITSPADVLNVALRRIGYKLRVGSLLEGSVAAKVALDIYAQTRDEVLRQDDWAFAERNVALALLKQAPVGGYIPPRVWTGATDPPLPWQFEYSYPVDCLKIRAVKYAPLFLPSFDPQTNLFAIDNDNYYNPARKVILTNVANAVLVYTGQITDPATWEADFVEEIAASLGRRLAPTLANPEMLKLMVGDEAASMQIAETEQG